MPHKGLLNGRHHIICTGIIQLKHQQSPTSAKKSASRITRRRISLQYFLLNNVELPNLQWIISVVLGTPPIPEEVFVGILSKCSIKCREIRPGSTNETRVLYRILLGQTSVNGGVGRYDRAACRDMRHHAREVARASRRGTAFAARTLRRTTP